MPVTDWFSPQRPCKKFKNHQQLYDGLVAMNNQAILCLQTKALPMVRKVGKGMGLSHDQTEEILNKSTLIFLQKIEKGAYEFKGHAPTTYLVEVAKRLAMAMVRKKKPNHEPLENHNQGQWTDYEEVERRQASADLVRAFLDKLSEACSQVIRLHHIDGYSDEEVIKGGLAAYSTIGSLKVKRSSCMKKLIEIATKWKTSEHI